MTSRAREGRHPSRVDVMFGEMELYMKEWMIHPRKRGMRIAELLTK